MTVEPIPFEHRYFVSSSSRGDVTHIVDLAYKEEAWSRPKCFCSCEESFIKGHICKHILLCVSVEKERLGL